MNKFLEQFRQSILTHAANLPADDIALVPTSRELAAIVDRQFENEVLKYRWYAVVSRGNHVYAVADIKGKRVSLQRLVLALAHPEKSVADFKQVSFENKLSFDCRITNLSDRVGRQSVMRNRKPKRNTSSKFKGVMKRTRGDGTIFWRGQIKSDLGTMSLGSFDDEDWAALVYDAAAFLLFDGAGHYNFPEICPHPEALLVAKDRILRFKNKKRHSRKNAPS